MFDYIKQVPDLTYIYAAANDYSAAPTDYLAAQKKRPVKNSQSEEKND